MIEVAIDSIRASLIKQERIIILKALHSDRFLPMFMGEAEVNSIIAELKSSQHEQPLPPDLLKFLGDPRARLVRVVINDILKEAFQACLVIEAQGKKTDFETRPGDAIALAVRAKAPIFVIKPIMKQFGVTPDKEI